MAWVSVWSAYNMAAFCFIWIDERPGVSESCHLWPINGGHQCLQFCFQASKVYYNNNSSITAPYVVINSLLLILHIYKGTSGHNQTVAVETKHVEWGDTCLWHSCLYNVIFSVPLDLPGVFSWMLSVTEREGLGIWVISLAKRVLMQGIISR